MEISGWDSVVFTFTTPREVFASVFESVVTRWPVALLDGIDEPPFVPEPLSAVSVDRLPAGPGHLMFYRDAGMVRHMKEEAYVPMADGDGPFAIITRIRRGVVFKLAGVNEFLAADHTPEGVESPDPYHAWLCSPAVVEVTAVTPGNPASHPFSSWVLSEVKRACSGSAEVDRSAPERL